MTVKDDKYGVPDVDDGDAATATVYLEWEQGQMTMFYYDSIQLDSTLQPNVVLVHSFTRPKSLTLRLSTRPTLSSCKL